jgi:hypothetical protein
MQKVSSMITYPPDLADRLADLLRAKNANGGYVLRKEHRQTVLEAEVLLRNLFK